MSSHPQQRIDLQLATMDKRENRFSKGVSLGIQTAPQGCPSPAVDGQQKANSEVFGRFSLSHNAFSGPFVCPFVCLLLFLALQIFYLYIMVSDFCLYRVSA